MAVYLEVVPTNARTASGTHTLEGSQCLVFFLGGNPAPSRPRHTGGMNVMLCDGSVRVAKDLDQIAAQLARTRIAGAMIIIGPAGQPGYATTRWQLAPGSKQVTPLGLTNAGGPVILIGLLLPAVQAARQAARTKARSPAIQQLASIVGPGGRVFVIGTEGELLSL